MRPAEYSDDQKACIDLHGYTVFEAEEELIVFLEQLSKTVKLVEVTHGYSHGTALKKMVKNDFYHWRIKQKLASINPGSTLFVLK